MTTAPPPLSTHFDAARAEVYDKQFVPLLPLKDTIHLLVRAHFAKLPADANILVAGAGTGAEVRFLAPLFPGWRFTLADPSAPMLDVARRHAEAEGFAARCTFHAGYVSALPDTQHDAATSIFVSHFLTDAGERQAYFADIAARLKPGGLMFAADHAADRDGPMFSGLMDHWMELIRVDNMAAPGRETFAAAFGRDFAAHSPAQVEALIEAAGFTPPVACFQAALMRGWTAAKR